MRDTDTGSRGQGYFLSYPVPRQGRNVRAVDKDGAGKRLQQAGHRAEKGAFPAAVAAEQGGQFSARESDGKVAEDRVAGVAYGKMIQDYHIAIMFVRHVRYGCGAGPR